MKVFSKNIKRSDLFQQVTIVVSLFVFLMSLKEPAFFVDNPKDSDEFESLYLLLMGWTSIIGKEFILFSIWAANPIYLAAIIMAEKYKPAGFYLGLIGSLLSFSFSLLDKFIANDSSDDTKITSLGLGYKLWLTSFLILTLGTLLSMFLEKREKKDVSSNKIVI